MRHANALQLVAAEHKQHSYLDYLIDGRPLSAHLTSKSSKPIDLISPFGWLSGVAMAAEAATRLLLQSPADFSSNRCSLLVCPMCADVACGAITAIIERDNNWLVWHSFGHESASDNSVRFADFAHIREFAFNALDYEAVFEPFLRAT